MRTKHSGPPHNSDGFMYAWRTMATDTAEFKRIPVFGTWKENQFSYVGEHNKWYIALEARVEVEQL